MTGIGELAGTMPGIPPAAVWNPRKTTMPFVNHPKLPGKIFVPELNPKRIRKHPCKDCFSCQMCGDDRCHVCRADAEKGKDEDADKGEGSDR